MASMFVFLLLFCIFVSIGRKWSEFHLSDIIGWLSKKCVADGMFRKCAQGRSVVKRIVMNGTVLLFRSCKVKAMQTICTIFIRFLFIEFVYAANLCDVDTHDFVSQKCHFLFVLVFEFLIGWT